MSDSKSDDTGPVKLFRNVKTNKRFLAAEEHRGSDDMIYAELNDQDESVIAGNSMPKDKFNELLDAEKMEADHNTVDFTFFGGKFIRRKRPERL